MSDFFQFVRDSFWHVAPILLVGAVALAITIERSMALFSRYPIRNTDAFFDKLKDLVMAGKLPEAISVCDRYADKPVAQVVKQALLRAHQPETLIQDGLEIAVGKETQKIQARTPFLSTIANVATLLGLFGTIAGLIQSFHGVESGDASQKSALLAQGISTAMNATMMGLGVAIPCMVIFSFLVNRSNHLVAEVDQAAVQALDILKQRFYAAELGNLKSVARTTGKKSETV